MRNSWTAGDARPSVTSRGGTWTCRSSGNCKGSRLVASNRSLDVRSSKASTTSATSSVMCSQLSSTTSSSRSATKLASAATRSAPASCRPIAVAIASAAWSAPEVGTRSTNHAPSAKSCATSAATAEAKRVLPVPPIPSSVTRRCCASISAISATSTSRPSSTVRSTGRLLLTRFSVRSGGNSPTPSCHSCRAAVRSFSRFSPRSDDSEGSKIDTTAAEASICPP